MMGCVKKLRHVPPGKAVLRSWHHPRLSFSAGNMMIDSLSLGPLSERPLLVQVPGMPLGSSERLRGRRPVLPLQPRVDRQASAAV